MLNFIFKFLECFIFFLLTSLITLFIGRFCLCVLEIDYKLTIYGAFAINVALMYFANFLNAMTKVNNND